MPDTLFSWGCIALPVDKETTVFYNEVKVHKLDLNRDGRSYVFTVVYQLCVWENHTRQVCRVFYFTKKKEWPLRLAAGKDEKHEKNAHQERGLDHYHG